MEIVALTETRMKSCSLHRDNCAFFSSGRRESSRPNGGVAFLIKKNLEAELNPFSNRLATLTLQIEGLNVGLTGCYAPTEFTGDTMVKESFYKLVAKTY